MDAMEELIEHCLRRLEQDRWLRMHAHRSAEWTAAIATELGLGERARELAECAALAQLPREELHGRADLVNHRRIIRAYWSLRDGGKPRDYARLGRIILLACEFEDLLRPRDPRLSLSPVHALDAIRARGVGDHESVAALRRVIENAPPEVRFTRPGSAKIAENNRR